MDDEKKRVTDEAIEEKQQATETSVETTDIEPTEEKQVIDEPAAETPDSKVEETVEKSGEHVEEKPAKHAKHADDSGNLVVMQQPDKVKYGAGERISFTGLTVAFDGVDVTNECVTSVKEGTPFPIDERCLDVEVKHEPSGKTIVLTLKRKRKLLIPILIGLLVAALVGAGIWMFTHPAEQKFPEGETGSYIIPKGNMSDEDAQKMLDEMTEKSRITVSIAPDMKLKDNGDLRVNLVVPEGNNGLSERLEIEQDGRVVYRSGVVSPGHLLEWGSNSTAHEGTATATIYAIQSDADFGNPVSVEVNISAE
jgi:hypothetical protein